MKSTLDLVPTVAVHPDKIITFNQVHWSPCRPSRGVSDARLSFQIEQELKGDDANYSKISHIIDSDRKSHGRVSFQARKKILKALDYLLLIATNKTADSIISGRSVSFKIAFVTLTLPSKQIHTDNEIKKLCLNQFLIEIERFYNVRNYVWRSERQENGNVHFHILIDKFIPYQELRDRWNRIINKLGYVDRYRDEQVNWHAGGFKVRKELLKTWDYQHQKEAYLRGSKNHWNSPNSTDIHSIRKIHNIKLYVIKYMAKNETEKPELKNSEPGQLYESGRIWSCSASLSNIKGAKTEIDNLIQKELEVIDSVEEIKRFKDTYFSVYYVKFDDLAGLSSKRLFNLFCRYLIEKFNFNYQVHL